MLSRVTGTYWNRCLVTWKKKIYTYIFMKRKSQLFPQSTATANGCTGCACIAAPGSGWAGAEIQPVSHRPGCVPWLQARSACRIFPEGRVLFSDSYSRGDALYLFYTKVLSVLTVPDFVTAFWIRWGDIWMSEEF